MPRRALRVDLKRIRAGKGNQGGNAARHDIKKRECLLWWAVAHIFNHHTHHRGQIMTLFTQQGRDPGVTDLFAMLHEEEAARRRSS